MIVFTSDVHLGLHRGDPAEREQRFVSWLRGLQLGKGDSLILLGDIWDFWYEYKYVVPKEGFRVVAALTNLCEAGVEVYFVPGNHDIWCFHWFEQLGMHKIEKQPAVLELEGKKIMIAHGEGLGKTTLGFRIATAVFHSRFCQALFSTIHPRLAFALGNAWSKDNRKTHKPYQWKGSEERLWKFAASQDPKIDLFVFGHLHCSADEILPGGARLVVLDSWLEGGTPNLTV